MKEINKRRIGIYFVIFIILLTFVLALSTRTMVRKNGEYDTKNEVALYIMKYDKLPKNFMTEDEANEMYIDKYDAIDHGINIDGGIFKNQKSPKCKDWIKNYVIKDYKNLDYDNIVMHECDIYSNRDKIVKERKRGPERLVYSIDGDFVYYTPTHYDYGKNGEPGFYKVTKFGINKTSNIFWIINGSVIIISIGFLTFYIIKKDDNKEYKNDLEYCLINVVSLILYIIALPFYLIYQLVLFIKNKIKKKEEVS